MFDDGIITAFGTQLIAMGPGKEGPRTLEAQNELEEGPGRQKGASVL